LILTSGGIGERRFHIAKDDGVKGSAVYADEFIAKDDIIGVYTGVRTAKSDSSTYRWSYYSKPIFRGQEVHIGIDAMHGGNMLRFINDGKKESLNVDVISVPWENRWYRIYTAMKDIYPGEELMVSYGSGYWKKRDFSL
jgi:SET domain-containing protein